MNQNANLPNLIIAGVNKAGTTSLYSYLDDHPQACGSSQKETCFFLPVRYGRPLPPIEDYSDFFTHCSNEKYVFESTPGYFYGGEGIALLLKKRISNLKIVIVVRDPVERMISFFKFQKSMLHLDSGLAFREYFERCKKISPKELQFQENNMWFGLEGGCYANYMDPWIENFGENLKIFFFEELKQNPHQFMEELCSWLDIENIYSDYDFKIQNKTKSFNNRWLHKWALNFNRIFESSFRKRPELKETFKKLYAFINGKKITFSITKADRKKLESYYEVYNKRLKKMLAGRKPVEQLPYWLKE